MLYQEIRVKAPGQCESGRLVTYLLDHSEKMTMSDKRPLVLICPGGGYEFVSEREAEPIAMHFLSMGIHAAILWYSVSPARYPQALLQVGASVKLLKENARAWHIDPDAIVIQGCSAGGHLAASYGVFWNSPSVREALQSPEEMLRPGGLLLCYPVITSGPFAHKASFENLLGEACEEKKEEMSLEKRVNADTPRTFLWHTASDELVPVENSVLFFGALHALGIPAELHIFPVGEHGLSLASPLTAEPDGTRREPVCESWMDLAKTWMEYYRRRT